MTIDELAREYEGQHKILQNKIKGLKPLLCIYSGEDLLLLRKRISVYYDMAFVNAKEFQLCFPAIIMKRRKPYDKLC